MSNDRYALQTTLISNVISRLAHAADFGTLEEYGALMADDVVWEYPGGSAVDLEPQVRRGIGDVLTGARERRESGIQGPGTETRHVVTNVAVEPGDGQARSMAYWHYFGNTKGTPTLLATGIYRDRFVLMSTGDWVLAHRRITVGDLAVL